MRGAGGAEGSGAKGRPGDEGAGRCSSQGRAEAAAAETEAEASHNQPPLLAIPLHVVAPNIPVPPLEEVDQEPPVMERREDFVIFMEGAPLAAPTGAGQGGQSAAAPEQPTGG